jgi:peptidyl-prolyl cis-trans isomerase SurA
MKILLVLVPLLIAPLVAHAELARPQPVEADRIIAIVNSEAITQVELRSRLAMVERQLKSQKVSLPPQAVLERQLLERMIVDQAQMQFAKDNGIQVSDADLDTAIRRIAESNRMALPDFKAALQKDGVAWNKFREEIRQEIVFSRLRDREVDSRLMISEGEIDSYLENAGRPGNNEELVQLAHIILRVPEQVDAAKAAAIRTRAEKALEQLRAGEDFGRVAASYSDAPDALNGGAIDWRPLDRLPGPYADAVQQMKPGEISGLIRTSAGFHIVKLVDRHGGAVQMKSLKQTHVRHILIKVNEVVSDSEANRKLVSLRERLDNGGDFSELARLHSNDLSAAKGGDLGWLYQGDTVPDFERAMDGLKIGQISEPVRSPFGWHLIQVLERRTEDASPERQRQLARQALRERKSDEAYQDWLSQLRDRAYVEYRLEDK